MEKRLNRRDFMKAAGVSAVVLSLGCEESSIQPSGAAAFNVAGARPNVLWISTEDISPDLGCYGDAYADSPNIDKFAAGATRYDYAFTNAGVCAPVRSCTITSMYPTSMGTNQMRCKGVPEARIKCFPEYLRAAGYYCTNRTKTDYQFDAPSSAWDESGRNGHWRNRPEGAPFFCVMNITTTHESKIRNKYNKLDHDPDKAKVPPYYPDTEVTRKDWARYADNITTMDGQAAAILKQLEEDGLAEDTIVWFWGDHGRGLPRAKRWIYDSGLKVPLIIRVPEKYRMMVNPLNPEAMAAGTVCNEMVSFVDFGATMLSIGGVSIPDHLHGRAFLGPQKREVRKYIYAARDRMDEAYDCIRAVRDRRYKYIRNFMRHVSYGQNIDYMNQMPTMKEMRRLNAEGKLKGAEKFYFLATKPVEEFYDLESDPHEINNLAGTKKYKKMIEQMRGECVRWMKEVGDVGLIPEPDFDQMKRPGDVYERTAGCGFMPAGSGLEDKPMIVAIQCSTEGASIEYLVEGQKRSREWKLYTKPVKLLPGEVLKARANRIGFKPSGFSEYKYGGPGFRAEVLASKVHWKRDPALKDMLDRLIVVKDLDFNGEKATGDYMTLLNDKYGPVRFWAVVGLHNNCKDGASITRAKQAVLRRLDDESVSTRVAAGQAVCDWGEEEKGLAVLSEILLNGTTGSSRLYAATALNRLGEKARGALDAIRASTKDKVADVKKVSRYTLIGLGEKV